MRHFQELSAGAQFRRLRRLALAAIERYPIAGPRLRALGHGENTTFRVDSDAGEAFLLRVCRPGYQTADSLAGERAWLQALTAHGLSVPRPVAGRDGDYVQTVAVPGVPEARRCLLFGWVPGVRRIRGRHPAHLRAVGRLLARLHAHALSWTPPPGFVRPRLDGERLVGAESVIGRVDDLATDADPSVRARLRAVREAVQAGLDAHGMPPEHSGLIHSDLFYGNVVFRDGEAHAIDFDDAAFGPHLFDIAVALGGVQDQAAHVAALIAGYREVRPLPDGLVAQLGVFYLARVVLVTAWIHSRADNPDIARLGPAFIQRALDAHDRYQQGRLVAV